MWPLGGYQTGSFMPGAGLGPPEVSPCDLVVTVSSYCFSYLLHFYLLKLPQRQLQAGAGLYQLQRADGSISFQLCTQSCHVGSLNPAMVSIYTTETGKCLEYSFACPPGEPVVTYSPAHTCTQVPAAWCGKKGCLHSCFWTRMTENNFKKPNPEFLPPFLPPSLPPLANSKYDPLAGCRSTEKEHINQTRSGKPSLKRQCSPEFAKSE